MSYKLEKVNELIRQELGKIILREEEFGPGVLVTVLAVQTSSDLRDATVFISVLPTKSGPTVLKKLVAHVFSLQRVLNKKLTMHPVPKIHFTLTEAEAESEKIETLLENIKKKDK